MTDVMNPYYIIEERNIEDCEWDTFTSGNKCYEPQIFAIRTLHCEDLSAEEYVETCFAHLCGKHIIQAWNTLITDVLVKYGQEVLLNE